MKTLQEVFETKIYSKWSPVYIEGKTIKDKDLLFSLIMRCDKFFDSNRIGGNDFVFNEAMWKQADIPQRLKYVLLKDKIVRVYSSQDNLKKLFDCSEEKAKELSKELLDKRIIIDKFNKDRKEEWKKRWGSIAQVSDCNVIDVDLFSSSSIRGASAFFNPRSGKIGSVHNINVDCATIGNSCKEQLETFTKTFPSVDLTISFSDYDENDCENVIASLRLFNGNISVVENRPLKELQKLYKTNYLKGSRNASANHSTLYYRIRNLFWKITNKWERIKNEQFAGCFFNNTEHYFTFNETLVMIQNWKYKKFRK